MVEPVLVEGFEPDPEKVARGIVMYHTTCAHCHGGLLASESVAPDLRESLIAANLDAFKAVLRNSALAARGMPLYDDLTDADIEGLYHYVRFGAATVGQDIESPDMDDCTFCGIAGSGPS